MFKEIFKERAETIRFFIGKENKIDPFKNIVETEDIACYPVKAIVSDLNFTQASYKMPGLSVDKAKLIIIEARDLSLLKQSYKIEIEDEFYYGWKVNGELQFRKEGDYLQLYAYIKKTEVN